MKTQYLDLKFEVISVLLSKPVLANVKTGSVAFKYSFFLLNRSRQKKILPFRHQEEANHLYWTVLLKVIP